MGSESLKTLRGISTSCRTKSASTPPAGMAASTSANDFLGRLSNAAARISRCSASALCPRFPARALSALTMRSSILRTIKLATVHLPRVRMGASMIASLSLLPARQLRVWGPTEGKIGVRSCSPADIASMARPLRIEFPGAIYHLTSRGDRRKSNFSAVRSKRIQLIFRHEWRQIKA